MGEQDIVDASDAEFEHGSDPVFGVRWAFFEYEYEYRFTEYEYEGSFGGVVVFWVFRTRTQSALADGTRTRTRFYPDIQGVHFSVFGVRCSVW